MRTNEIKIELNEVKKWEEKIIRNDLKYGTKNYTYDSQAFQTIRFFGDNITSGKITTSETDEDQRNLSINTVEFNDKTGPRSKKGKNK